MSTYDDSRAWLAERLAHPFLAEAPTSLHPERVSNRDCVSAVLSSGARTWAFKRKRDRDEFVRTHDGARAA